MADNSAQNATDTIATDELTLLNGVASTIVKVQRSKIGFGVDGELRDVSNAFPMPTSTPDATTSGALAALNATLPLVLNGTSGAAVQLSGTWGGTVTFEGTLDGTSWFPVNAVSASTSTPQTTTTANGLYRLTPSGLSSIRANMTAFASGSASVVMRASSGAGGTFANQILPTKLTDGTSTQAIKPASTAALATDAAAVVAISPNSTMPQPDVNVTGTITTTDIVVTAPAGAGGLVSGASTAGSFVFAAITGGYTAWVAQITGLTSGTIYFEGSVDSTNGTDGNFINLIGRQIGILNSLLTGSATGNGNWRGNLSSYKFFRLRSVGALTGTPAIVIRMSAGVATVFLNGSLPAGTNTIGAANVNTANVSAVTVMHNATAAAGLTVGASMPITGYGTSSIKVTGTFVGSMAFKVSQDAGATWDNISGTQVGGGDIFTVATQPGSYRFTVANFDLFRVEVTLTSGSITINGKSTNAVNASKVVKLATSGLTIGVVNQGLAAAIANSWPIKVTDGTSAVGVTSSAIAGNETTVDRMKVNAALRVLDTALAAGSQLVAARGDQTTGLWVNLKNTSVAVTGTFFQATQPVSNLGTFAVQAAATLAAETTKIIGTVNVAAGQTIAATQATAASLQMTATPIALTKGTQGATGFTTQDLKDAGRVAVSFTAEFSPIAVAEAMLSLSVSRDGATPAATTSYVIPTGKRLRITSISNFVETTLGTSIQRAYLRMRFAATAGAVVTSPLQMSIPVAAAGVPKSISNTFEDVPDGLEFLGDGVRAIGLSLQAPDWVTAASTLKVYVTAIGFEY